MKQLTPNEPVTIVLHDGRERGLRYSMATLRRIKQDLGVSLLRGGLENIDEDKISALIYLGLTDKAGITPEEIDEALDSSHIPYLLE